MITIGDIAKLKVPLMGNKIGSMGVCYTTYKIIEPGWSFIFENGIWRDFDEEEAKHILSIVGHSNDIERYQFTNTIQLAKDFEDKDFKLVLEVWHTLAKYKG